MKKYTCNECFYSLQGEGARVGTPNVFVRLSGCNLKCDGGMEEGIVQPVCDTEFVSGRQCTLEEIAEWAAKSVQLGLGRSEPIYGDGLVGGYHFWPEPWLVITGGEPALQVDEDFCNFWHHRGCKLAIETNGTIELPQRLDWITVSPKTAEHTLKQTVAHEVKYVRGWGQGIPKSRVTAEHYFISPHFEGDYLHPHNLNWCKKLCLENPPWRLSVQQHKLWGMR